MNFIKMNKTNGYIYVRNHPSYDVDDACKMGKANNIPERDMLVAKLREDIYIPFIFVSFNPTH